MFKSNSVIEFMDFDKKVLIWRHPEINFDLNSTLIVPSGCVGILLSNGAIVEIYDAGGHELNTDNRSWWARHFDKKAKATRCQVYFVNKTVPIIGYWGTRNPIEFIEKETRLPVTMGASGSFKISIQNPSITFIKLVGAQKELTLDYITEYFSAMICQEVRETLSNIMQNSSFYEMANSAKKLSKEVALVLSEYFNNYGIALNEFIIEALAFPQEVKDMIAQYAREEYIYKNEKHLREIRANEDQELKQQARMEKLQEIEDEFSIRKKLVAEEKELREEDRQDVRTTSEAISNINKSIPLDKTDEVTTVSDGIFCMECGKKNPIGSKCCCECGRKLDLVKAICECGAPIIEGSKFCHNCGKATRNN